MRDHLSWERLGAVSQDRFHCTHVTACHLAPSVTRPDLTQYHGGWKIHGIKNNVIREVTHISVTNNKSQDICDKDNNQRLLLWPWRLADSGTPHKRLPHKSWYIAMKIAVFLSMGGNDYLPKLRGVFFSQSQIFLSIGKS
jgi:hypothetical protein